jgi:hypothetical protein
MHEEDRLQSHLNNLHPPEELGVKANTEHQDYKQKIETNPRRLVFKPKKKDIYCVVLEQKLRFCWSWMSKCWFVESRLGEGDWFLNPRHCQSCPSPENNQRRFFF